MGSIFGSEESAASKKMMEYFGSMCALRISPNLSIPQYCTDVVSSAAPKRALKCSNEKLLSVRKSLISNTIQPIVRSPECQVTTVAQKRALSINVAKN